MPALTELQINTVLIEDMNKQAVLSKIKPLTVVPDDSYVDACRKLISKGFRAVFDKSPGPTESLMADYLANIEYELKYTRGKGQHELQNKTGYVPQVLLQRYLLNNAARPSDAFMKMMESRSLAHRGDFAGAERVFSTVPNPSNTAVPILSVDTTRLIESNKGNNSLSLFKL